jgi:alkanesulfonate monooxygenase SsuD/methylene tetrahydromethanopterin reductase-like flavin-dependent oxidoreductase (luciferase family)
MKRLGVRYDLRSFPAAQPPPACRPDGGGPGEREPEERYAELLDHAARAERIGADVLWVAERPFVPGALLPAAFPLCAALAERTARARIASGALPLPLHHPLRVAEDAAVLDVISGGRFELGVGLGEHVEGFDGFGIPIHERAGRFEEALALVRMAWTEPAVRFAGQHYEIAELALHPRPVQRPHPPIWIAGSAEAAVRRAARLGTGLLTDSLDAARRFLAVWPELGRAGGEPRIAWYVDPGGADPEPALPRIRAGLDALAGAAVELLVPALPARASVADALAGLERLSAALRPAFAG